MQQSLEDMQRPIIYLILFLLLCIHVSLSFDDDVWYANEQDITCSLSRFHSFSFDYSFSFTTNIWNCQKHQGYLLQHNIGINRYHHDIHSFRLFSFFLECNTIWIYQLIKIQLHFYICRVIDIKILDVLYLYDQIWYSWD